ncbi:MAG: VCBS domain-containing protein, partial [Neomegalonema sp.]|nr:VCBS domain-containing protein [Neomegalonema sp.]
TPDADYNGADSFTYTVSDGTTSVEHTVSVTVTAINDAPVASSAAPTLITALEDGEAVALGWDVPSDIDGDALTITITELPLLGQIALTDGPTLALGDTLPASRLSDLRYLPPADYDGSAPAGDFVIAISDGEASTEQRAAFTIVPVADPAILGGELTGSVTEDQTATDAPSLLRTQGVASVFDPDPGEAAFVAAQVDGALGSFAIDAAGHWLYEASNEQEAIQSLGADDEVIERFTVRSVDGSVAEILVTISGANDAPQITSTDPLGLNENEERVITLADLAVVDAEGDETAALIVSRLPQFGVLLLEGEPVLSVPASVTRAQIDAGALTYLPPRDANGSAFDHIEIAASDGADTGAAVTLVFDVAPQPSAPVLSEPGSIDPADPEMIALWQVSEGVSFAKPALAGAFFDPDGDVLTFALAPGAPDWIAIDPATGAISGNPPADGSAGGADGLYRIGVIATDTTGLSVTGIVQIAVSDTPPVQIAPIDLEPVYGQALGADLSENVEGVGNEPLLYALEGAPEWLSIDPDTGELMGTVPDDYAGDALTFSLTVRNAQGGSLTISVSAPIALSEADAPIVLPVKERSADADTVEMRDEDAGQANELEAGGQSRAQDAVQPAKTSKIIVTPVAESMDQLTRFASQQTRTIQDATAAFKAGAGTADLSGDDPVLEVAADLGAQSLWEPKDGLEAGFEAQRWDIDGARSHSVRGDQGNGGGFGERAFVEAIMRENTLLLDVFSSGRSDVRIEEVEILGSGGAPLPVWAHDGGAGSLIAEPPVGRETLPLRVRIWFADGGYFEREILVDLRNGTIEALAMVEADAADAPLTLSQLLQGHDRLSAAEQLTADLSALDGDEATAPQGVRSAKGDQPDR